MIEGRNKARMLALRKTGSAFGADVTTAPTPDVPAGHVLVEVAAAGICGSDLHAYEWSRGYEFMADSLPTTLGHEFAGTVRALGEGVAEPLLGARVACWPTIGCGHCAACLSDRRQNCAERRIVGLHSDGGFAEAVSLPAENCLPIPDGLSFELAALVEPLGVAINALDVCELREGENLVVLGPGPIGLAVAVAARLRGCDEVVLVGRDDPLRLDVAREMGVLHTVDLSAETLAHGVERTFGGSADRVIEATGSLASVTGGLEILRPGGVLVVAGIHSQDLVLDLTNFVRSKKQLRAAHDTSRDALKEAMELLAGYPELFSMMITQRFPLADAVQAFEAARRRAAVKIMLLPGATAGMGVAR